MLGATDHGRYESWETLGSVFISDDTNYGRPLPAREEEDVSQAREHSHFHRLCSAVIDRYTKRTTWLIKETILFCIYYISYGTQLLLINKKETTLGPNYIPNEERAVNFT